jgi:hypothetical protein
VPAVRVPFHVPPGLPLPVSRFQVPVKLFPSADRVKVSMPVPVLSDHTPLRKLPEAVPVMVPAQQLYVPFTELPPEPEQLRLAL